MEQSDVQNSLLINKLKPSKRNKLISKKYNLNTDNQAQTFGLKYMNASIDLKNCNIEPILTEGTVKSTTNYVTKWSQVVRDTKNDNMHIDLSQSEVMNIQENNKDYDNFSMISENMEYISNFIEENYQMVLTENLFLRQESHSIIPFLTLNSSEIHRMCLSDYEIKHVYRQFKKKYKTHRTDGMDYYKIGLINFYKRKFVTAYSNFKFAFKLRPNEGEIAKWLAFSCLTLIFCINNKVNFKDLKNCEITNDKDTFEDEDSFLFACCSNRKRKVNTIGTSTIKTDSNMFGDYTSNNNNTHKINKVSLCKEAEELLNNLIEDEKQFIEIYWMKLIICSYCKVKTDQSQFRKEFLIDPKICIKKIKEKDTYLSYLAYIEYNRYISEDKNVFNVSVVLSELITKYPNRIEGFLRYWSILVKEEKNYKLAQLLSEMFCKNASSSFVNLENNVYQ
jgi:hypothetical protein